MKQLSFNEKIAVAVGVIFFTVGFLYFFTDLFTGSIIKPVDTVYLN